VKKEEKRKGEKKYKIKGKKKSKHTIPTPAGKSSVTHLAKLF